jgi:hypothetical protein
VLNAICRRAVCSPDGRRRTGALCWRVKAKASVADGPAIRPAYTATGATEVQRQGHAPLIGDIV